jgi:hypothetical protein
MATNQALQTHGACELNVESPRKPEHHDKEEHTNRAAIGQMIAASFSPVCLSLFAWRRLEANDQMRRPAHTQSGQEMADNACGAPSKPILRISWVRRTPESPCCWNLSRR